jgi:hypothetical protein
MFMADIMIHLSCNEGMSGRFFQVKEAAIIMNSFTCSFLSVVMLISVTWECHIRLKIQDVLDN